MTNSNIYNNILVMDEGADTSMLYYAESSFFGKLNKTGMNVWHNYYSFPSSSFYCNDVMKISDTTFCAVGSYNSKGSCMIINKNGAFKSSRSYSLIGDIAHEVIMNPSRILFLSTLNNNPEFYLTKTDLTGNLITSKKISLPTGSYAPYNLSKTLVKINPNLYIISVTNNSLPVYQFDIATIAVDSSLNVVWSKLMEGERDEYPASGIAVGSNYFVVSKTNSFGVGMNDIMLTCMDTLGNIVWNKTFGTSSNDEFPMNITLDKDSTFIIAGSIQDAALNSSGLLTKINLNGNIIWSRKYNAPPGYKDLSFHRAIRSANGLIRTTYHATKISDSYIYAGFMDLEPSGNAPCLSSPINPTEKNVPLPLTNYATTVNAISPVVTSNVATVISIPNTFTTICASVCNTYADMSISSTRICSGDSIHVKDLSSNAISINWLVDGMSASASSSYSFVLNTPGAHTVSIIANGSTCTDTLTTNVLVDSFPSAAFSFTQQAMIGNFTNLSTGNETNLWILGDGIQYPTINVNHAFSLVDTYTNCLIASNGCGSDTVCHSFNATDPSNFTFNSFYDDPGQHTEWGIDVCQDPDGKLVVAAQDLTAFLSSDDDLAFLKLNQTGKVVKQKMLYTYTDEYPKKIISLGARGYSIISQQGALAIITLLDTAFNAHYSKSFGSFTPNSEFVSKSGSIYISGYDGVSTGAVVKMSKNLNQVWAKYILGANRINALTIGGDGSLIVVGKTAASETYISKIDTLTGNILWSKYYTTSTGMQANDIAYDSISNSFYIAGTINPSGISSYTTSFIMKTDTAGTIIWKHIFEMSGHIAAKRCFVNQYGQVFLCHTSTGYNFITRMDGMGNIEWSENYHLAYSFANLLTNGYSLCYDGGIAMAGTVMWGANDDVFAIKIDTSGIANTCYRNVPTFTTPAYSFALGTSAGDASSDLASGFSNFGYLINDYLYIDSASCDGITVNVKEEGQNEFTIYPNPYSSSTTIAYSLMKQSNLLIEIYNTVGQKIETIVNENQIAGDYKYNFSAQQKGFDAGIYFVKFNVDGKTSMKKIIEIK